MQKSEKSRTARGKRAWRSSGSEASSDISPAPLTSLVAPPPPPPPPPAVVPHLLHRGERRRERGLRRLWTAVRSASGGGGAGGGDEPAAPGAGVADDEALKSTPTCSLPLLQVWPTQESPRGEADGQSFVFPLSPRSPHAPLTPNERFCLHDSGIDSIQVSPSVAAGETSPGASPSGSRRGGSGGGLLHPEHARLLRQSGLEEPEPPGRLSASSSTASSLASVHHSPAPTARTSDPWLRDDRRRSSTLTMTRYSLFDALDLEYALLRAAARGSVGPYSLSESLHKLTFTQSLAFPALARGLAGKRARTASAAAAARAPSRRTGAAPHAYPHPRAEPALNVFAKVVTTLVLVLVSVLVFGVVYKFVRT